MNKKLIGILLIVVSLIISLVVLYFVFFYNPPVKEIVVEPEPYVPPATTTINKAPEKVVKPRETTPASEVELTEEGARQTASSFAQMYGSYSNQDDLSRLNDLKFYVTSEYLTVIANQLKNINDGYHEYVGYVTRAITTRSLIMEKSRSVVMVSTKRSERKNDGTERSYSQDIKVEMLKSGRGWLINNAVWQ